MMVPFYECSADLLQESTRMLLVSAYNWASQFYKGRGEKDVLLGMEEANKQPDNN